jgi:hypothetical protein
MLEGPWTGNLTQAEKFNEIGPRSKAISKREACARLVTSTPG